MEHDDVMSLFDKQKIKTGDLLEITLKDGTTLKAVLRTPRPFGELAEKHAMSYEYLVSRSRIDLLPPDILPSKQIQPEAFTIFSKDIKTVNKIDNLP